MNGLLLLTTDTRHHRYLANRIRDAGLDLTDVLFETVPVEAPFPVGPLFEAEQDGFEAARFTGDMTWDRFHTQRTADFNSAEAAALIRRAGATLGIVFGARRLSPATLALFPDGLVNVHRGIAEEYRGLDSDLWAIYHRDYRNLGVTLHMVAADLDAGDIVAERRLSLTRDMRCHHLRYHTTVIATDLMIETLRRFRSGEARRRPQARRGRSYSFMPLELKRIVARRFDRHCEALGDA